LDAAGDYGKERRLEQVGGGESRWEVASSSPRFQIFRVCLGWRRERERGGDLEVYFKLYMFVGCLY